MIKIQAHPNCIILLRIFEWGMTKPSNKPFSDELISIMGLQKYDFAFLSKTQKDKTKRI